MKESFVWGKKTKKKREVYLLREKKRKKSQNPLGQKLCDDDNNDVN